VSGSSVALDTSAAIAILAGQAGTLLSQSIEPLLLPVPVIGELRYGALNSRRAAQNLADVEQLIGRCRVLGVTETTAAVYARIRLGLKEKGKPIPEDDVWIAALCVEHHGTALQTVGKDTAEEARRGSFGRPGANSATLEVTAR